MKISVIVPIFKVEKFIERCAESLFNQTFDDFEVIFVDDASPDSSIKVLESVIAKYPAFHNRVKIMRHEKNKGLPAARNSGLKVATGDYIYHLDSDDYIEQDMLEEMVNAAQYCDADIVYCDFFLSTEYHERFISQPNVETTYDALRYTLGGKLKYNVWNKLVRRQLYTINDISFPLGYSMGEDMTMIKLIACAKTIVHVHKPLYHYIRYNSNALSFDYGEKNLISLNHNVNDTVKFINTLDIKDKEILTHFFRLSVKYPFLIGGLKKGYDQWQLMFPESNKYIFQNPYSDFKSKFLQLSAKNKLFYLIKLYNLLIYRILYPIIYS